jgi:hypothetical protein
MSTVDELFWYCDRRTGTYTYPDESGYILEVYKWFLTILCFSHRSPFSRASTVVFIFRRVRKIAKDDY